jgi:hypothetical protein
VNKKPGLFGDSNHGDTIRTDLDTKGVGWHFSR